MQKIVDNIFLIFIVSLLLIFILPHFYGGMGILYGFIFAGCGLFGYGFSCWIRQQIKNRK